MQQVSVSNSFTRFKFISMKMNNLELFLFIPPITSRPKWHVTRAMIFYLQCQGIFSLSLDQSAIPFKDV